MERNEIVALLNSQPDAGYAEIARQAEVTREWVRQIANIEGLERTKTETRIQKLLTDGKDYVTIGELLDSSVSHIRKAAKKLGMERNEVSDRFWSKVKRGSVDECWPWQAGCTSKGYGRFAALGYSESCHRMAYKLTYPETSIVRIVHTCTNRLCCNPAHLEARMV